MGFNMNHYDSISLGAGTIAYVDTSVIDYLFDDLKGFTSPDDDYDTVLVPEIKNVIFNDPATIVFWSDGTKTVVQADKEKYDAEKGLTMAITKKALGNKGNYYEVIKKWVGDRMLEPDESAK